MDLVRHLVAYIGVAEEKPLILFDLEGVDLLRNGVISLMQILVPPSPVAHLVDVHTLQKEVFDAAWSGGQTLRTIFGFKDYAKFFFDVRNDSDALYSHFQISLNGAIDLQLLEYASCPRKGKVIKGLANCVAEDADLSWPSTHRWQATKNARQSLFASEKGGRYELFLERPLLTVLQ